MSADKPGIAGSAGSTTGWTTGMSTGGGLCLVSSSSCSDMVELSRTEWNNVLFVVLSATLAGVKSNSVGE